MDIPANSVTLTLNGGEEELYFTTIHYPFVSIANLGSENIQASRTPNISSNSDGIGIVTIPPNSAVNISTLGGRVYVLGSGLITAVGSNSANNSFKIGKKGGENGENLNIYGIFGLVIEPTYLIGEIKNDME